MSTIHLNVSKKAVLWLCLVIPYFEPLSVTILATMGYTFFVWMGYFFSIWRILNDIYILINIGTKIKVHAISAKCIILYCIWCAFLSIMKGQFAYSLVLAFVNNVCFALYLDYMINGYTKECLRVLCFFFGSLSILGAVNVIVMPNGFFNVAPSKGAVYLLGSKNWPGDYFSTFVLLLLLYRSLWKYKIRNRDLVLVLFFIYCCTICNSAGSTVSLGIIFIYMFVQKFWKKIYRIYRNINLNVVFMFCGILILCIIFMDNMPYFKSIMEVMVKSLGKDIGFSGRRIIWKQAIDFFVEHPLIGNRNVIYWIDDIKWEPHAHNMYLDVLAKGGFLSFLLLIASIAGVFMKIERQEKKGMFKATKAVFLAVLLIRMCTEDVAIPLLALILILIEQVKEKKNLSNLECKRSFVYDLVRMNY